LERSEWFLRTAITNPRSNESFKNKKTTNCDQIAGDRTSFQPRPANPRGQSVGEFVSKPENPRKTGIDPARRQKTETFENIIEQSVDANFRTHVRPAFLHAARRHTAPQARFHYTDQSSGSPLSYEPYPLPLSFKFLRSANLSGSSKYENPLELCDSSNSQKVPFDPLMHPFFRTEAL